MIWTHVDSRKQLTTHRLIGKITFEDLLDEIKKFYDKEPTPNNLWNLLEADVSKNDGIHTPGRKQKRLWPVIVACNRFKI